MNKKTIITISGKAGSGKSYLTDEIISLIGGEVFPTTFRLKKVANDTFKELGFDTTKYKKQDYRDFLIALGELGRSVSEDFWIKENIERIKNDITQDVYIIDDVRFENELNLVESLKEDFNVLTFKSIRTSKESPEVLNTPMETGLDHIDLDRYDFVKTDDTTIEDIKTFLASKGFKLKDGEIKITNRETLIPQGEYFGSEPIIKKMDKNSLNPKEKFTLIVHAGKKGTGKSFNANLIKNTIDKETKIYSIATTLKKISTAIFEELNIDISTLNKEDYRPIFITVGNLGRLIDANFWTLPLLHQIIEESPSVAIIDDLRIKNELDVIKTLDDKLNIILLKSIRESIYKTSRNNDDVTETGLDGVGDDVYDFVFDDIYKILDDLIEVI